MDSMKNEIKAEARTMTTTEKCQEHNIDISPLMPCPVCSHISNETAHDVAIATARTEIRRLCYSELGTTYNEIELFLSNRFTYSHAPYWAEWINRLCRPNACLFMDSESLAVWLAVLKVCNKDTYGKLPEVSITGKPE